MDCDISGLLTKQKKGDIKLAT